MKVVKLFGLGVALALLITVGTDSGVQRLWSSTGEDLFISTVAGGGCVSCDVDHDGDTGVEDLALVARSLGQTATHVNDSWKLTGNAGTDPSVNFLGTVDKHDLILKTNGTQAVRMDPDVTVRIGPRSGGDDGVIRYKLDVNGTIRADDVITKGQHDIRAYGAIGDGATDDGAAIQAAIDAAGAAGGGTVFISDGGLQHNGLEHPFTGP